MILPDHPKVFLNQTFLNPVYEDAQYVHDRNIEATTLNIKDFAEYEAREVYENSCKEEWIAIQSKVGTRAADVEVRSDAVLIASLLPSSTSS